MLVSTKLEGIVIKSEFFDVTGRQLGTVIILHKYI